MGEPTWDVHRGGSGSPLVLLHGAAMSHHVWAPVRDALQAHHEVTALTMPGHRGGPSWTAENGTFAIDGFVDAVCDQLDELGIDTAHVAGNSLGGWVALELVRRGRARSAVALSPAGVFTSGWSLRRVLAGFRLMRAGARRPSLETLGRRPAARRVLLRPITEHGERVPVPVAAQMNADISECEMLTPMLATRDTSASTRFLRTDGCPVRVAWAEHDRLLPWARYGAPLREIVPDAEFVLLPGVGHVPMWEAPELVADVVLGVTLAVDGPVAPTLGA